MLTKKFFHMVLALIKPFRQKIKFKLFIMVLIIIWIPTSIFGFLSLRMSSNIIEEDYIKYKKQIIEQVALNLDDNIYNLVRQSIAVYTNLQDIIYILNHPDVLDIEYIQTNNRVEDFLKSILQSNDKFNGITLLSIKGEVIYYRNRGGGSINLYNVSDEPWFNETLSLRGFPLLREPHINRFVNEGIIHNKEVISISRAIVDITSNNSTPLGVLLIDQDVSKLTSILTQIKNDPNEMMMVLGKYNDLLYTSKPLNPPQYEKLLSSIKSVKKNSLYYDLNGETMLVNYMQSPRYEWQIISLLPYSEIQGKSHFLKKITIFLLLILTVLTFLISYLFSNMVTSPFKKMMRSFRELQRGNFNTKIKLNSQDELRQIGDTFNVMVDNIRNLIQQKYELTLMHKQAELKALQNQINPHFLYNTLYSIEATLDDQDIPNTKLMLQSLSDIFRYNLEFENRQVTFQEELEHAEKYIYIQKRRFSDKFEVQYDVDDEVLNFPMLRFTLQPLVENAIFHGIELLRKQGMIKIIAKTHDNRFYIYITDNGMGIDKEKLNQITSILAAEKTSGSESPDLKHTGLGIQNVNDRIKYYFGTEYGLQIFSSPDSGTTVKITLPAHKGEEHHEYITH